MLSDPNVLELVELWGRNVSDKVKEQIGKTRVFLNGSEHECRLRECSLANLVTDAMVHVVRLCQFLCLLIATRLY